MYKTALAAFSLALSLGLSAIPVSAQDQSSQQGQGQNNGQGNGNGNSTSGSSGSSSSGNSNSSGSGSGNNSGTNSADKGTDSKSSTASSSSSSASTKATPAAPAPVYVQTYGKYANTAKPVTKTTMTSTGEQKSTSTTTTTKTASIGKGGATGTSASTTATAATTTTSKKSKDEVVVLQESGDKKYTSTKNKQWQTFESYITLKPNQETLPLTMTVTNEGYTGINMVLAGNKLASDKDFKGSTLRMQMTGALAAGDNKLAIQLYGPVGAKLSWKLTTLKPTIVSIKPLAASTEDDITITGRNFAKSAGGNLVYVGSKVATVKSGSTGKEIVFRLPTEVQSGKQNVVVRVCGIDSKPFELSVKFAPEVTGVDLLSGPPGQQMTISGKGFSASQSENIVTIGGTPAAVISSSAKSITVTIPEMFFPQWNLPVVVKTGGIESKSAVKVNVQSRVIPNDGVPEQ
jgi:hypothetical protein